MVRLIKIKSCMVYVVSVTTCPLLPSVAHSTIKTTSATYGTAVTVICDVGYWFPFLNLSTVTVYCGENQMSQWSQNVTDCKGQKIA